MLFVFTFYFMLLGALKKLFSGDETVYKALVKTTILIGYADKRFDQLGLF